MEYKTTRLRQDTDLLVLNLVVHVVTIRLWRFQLLSYLRTITSDFLENDKW
jgi:hypothetical protein